MGLDEQRVLRSLGTFAVPDPHIIDETDAALSGVGVLIFRQCNARDVFLGGSGADITKLGFGVDSSFQNLAEFAGAILSLVCIVKLGFLREVQDSGFGLQGDSSERWLQTASVDLRTKADSNGDKSPTPEGAFERMRLTHWYGMGWESGPHMTSKSAYLANMLAFDVIGGRVKQYAMRAPEGVNHCIKCEDLVFVALPSRETEASTTTRVRLKTDVNFPNVDSRLIAYVALLYCTYLHPYVYTVSRTAVQLLHRM